MSVLSRSPRFTLVLSLALATGLLGGCTTRSNKDVTGSISEPTTARSPEEWRSLAASYAPKYDANPGDRVASMNYARALRGAGQAQQAVAVMQNAALKSPNDREVLALYGRTLADAGRLQEAAQVLANAHSPDQPDWRIYNVQGAVADELGNHAEAQGYYNSALKIVPNEPSVLSNLGLSFALQKRLGEAETLLRQAVEQPKSDIRTRANLALVLALQGKFQEAETVASRDLSPADAAANIAFVRSMVTQANSWKQIKQLDKKKPPTAG